jgi:hypothetical protein
VTRSLVYGSVLVFASITSAQSPPIGAVVQTSHYDPATHFVTVRINNTSQKAITALSMTVLAKYTDGTQGTADAGVDFLGEDSLGSFAAGSSHDERLYQVKDIRDFSAVIDVVIYADGTADVHNTRAFDGFVARRKGRVLALQQIDSAISQSIADPANTNPNVTVLAEFGKMTKILNAKTSVNDVLEGSTDNYLRRYVERLTTDLQNKSSHAGQSDREYLQAMVKRHEEIIAKATPHTQLVKGGAQ